MSVRRKSVVIDKREAVQFRARAGGSAEWRCRVAEEDRATWARLRLLKHKAKASVVEHVQG